MTGSDRAAENKARGCLLDQRCLKKNLDALRKDLDVGGIDTVVVGYEDHAFNSSGQADQLASWHADKVY